jgi:hypothetical protein
MTTTYTHTCDLCGAARPRGELRRFSLVAISEGDIVLRDPMIQGLPCDVCPACRERPIAELLTFLEARETERDRPSIFSDMRPVARRVSTDE